MGVVGGEAYHPVESLEQVSCLIEHSSSYDILM
jgi:hypothetical protein